jgi:hypothetical protein
MWQGRGRDLKEMSCAASASCSTDGKCSRIAMPMTPIDHDTVFEAGSVSQTVFAYAIMKPYETGALDLDTPLTHYTPLRFLEGDPRLDLITARHLLSHIRRLAQGGRHPVSCGGNTRARRAEGRRRGVATRVA